MSNLSYCRFYNTVSDLRDCAENLEEELEKGEIEDKARKQLITIAFRMVSQFIDVDEDSGELRLNTDRVDELPTEDVEEDEDD